jgi:hypothetical protein
MAKEMGITPNYLYRILPDLAKDGKVKKSGKGLGTRAVAPPLRNSSQGADFSREQSLGAPTVLFAQNSRTGGLIRGRPSPANGRDRDAGPPRRASTTRWGAALAEGLSLAHGWVALLDPLTPC